MSWQTDITQAVANLTNRLNAITEGAKKIFELTWQSSLNPASEIHVSIGGVSQKINIQQIVDAILSFRQNQLLSIGTISVVDNDVTIPANAQWVINNVNYFNIADIVINVPYAADGYTRNDILVADTENNIVRIIGPETEGVSPTPNVPLNTVLVTTLDVTDSTIGYTPPVIGTNFELLENKQNDLTPDGSGVKYPTVDAIIAGLLNKADLVSGKVPQSQLPSYVDDVIEGYLLSNVFYVESGHTTVIPAETGKIYIDLTSGESNKQYRYSGSTYIQISNGLIASTTDVPEGTNLYFTAARVLATALSSVSFALGGPITSADTILSAFGRIQKQINDLSTVYQLILTEVNFGSFINSLTSKTTPINADIISVVDTADSNKQKKVSLTNFKAFLKTYFDTVYQAILVSGTNIKTVGGNSIVGSGDIPVQVVITTAVSINTSTAATGGYTQHGKNIIIDNSSAAINYTVNAAITASYVKHGTGAITFVQGSGRTLVQVDGTAILNGVVGSTASISSVGTVDYLRISNA